MKQKEDQHTHERMANVGNKAGLKNHGIRIVFDELSQIEKEIDGIPDLNPPEEKSDDKFVASLEVMEDVLKQNQFNSDQVNSYYWLQNRKSRRKNNMPIYVIVAAIALFFVSLYLLIGDIPRDWKGVRLFYFNPHDAITMSDLLGVFLLFVSSLLFLKQMLKLLN